MANDRVVCIWSPIAMQDLVDIWEFVANDASPAIADALLRNIDRACSSLFAWSKIGRARDDVRKGLHSVRSERYVVFYRITGNAIEIVRVLDERRDVESIFSDEA